MLKIIKEVITLQDSFDLYKGLTNENMWALNRISTAGNMGGAFPGVTFLDEGEIIYNDRYWIGYFKCLFDRINQKLKEQRNFNIPSKIRRIALNAQNNNHYTEFHGDSCVGNSYSIVGFLTPQWAEEWGGELNVQGEVIKYVPGDFILFDSTKTHSSQKIKKETPYWRTSINYLTEYIK